MKNVSDKEIIKIVEKTVDQKNEREWYYALMDYGAFIKATTGNVNTKSAGYKKQSQFEGSLRQVRGMVLRELASEPKQESYFESLSDSKVPIVLSDLCKEGLIYKKSGIYYLGV